MTVSSQQERFQHGGTEARRKSFGLFFSELCESVVDYFLAILHMAAGAKAQGWEQPSRRRGLRYPVQAPLEVTVLRSGIPDSLPGRSVNLGEGGVAAVLAGELLPGEAVGVEIRLPLESDRLRTRARVRHHDKLRSGMEFIGLSPEQRAAIRVWAGKAKAEPEPRVAAAISDRNRREGRFQDWIGRCAASYPQRGMAGDGSSCWCRPRSSGSFVVALESRMGRSGIWLAENRGLGLRPTFPPT